MQLGNLGKVRQLASSKYNTVGWLAEEVLSYSQLAIDLTHRP